MSGRKSSFNLAQQRLQKSIRNEYSPILGTDVFEMPVEELSEKQKYQLVYTRVFLQKPEILFCIQPFCGADLAHRMFIWSMLEKFLDKGISVVILSLNLSDSLAMADRLLILGENGKKKEIVRENFHKITSRCLACIGIRQRENKMYKT